MQPNRCSSCGTPGAPTDQFCENCGTRLAPTIAPYPYYPSYGPPPKNHTALIVVIVVIAVVVLVVLPAVLYVLVSGLIVGPPSPPRFLGISVSRSADGTAWILTFTSVPSGLAQSGTFLTLISSSGGTLLPPTTLSSLEGSGMNGVAYVPYLTDPSMTSCASGDRITISVSLYPAGSQAQLSNAGYILFAGTLQ